MAGELRIIGVTKRFPGGVTALDNVSLTISTGEFVTLLGPSGCGKTTLLRIVAGFETADRGEITLDGIRLDTVPAYHRPVGMVFQSLALFPHLSVARNLAFSLNVKRVAANETRRRVEEALALVDLSGYGSRRIHQLSGGQRQRVALARALISNPNMLLLDEPLSALDLKLRRALQGELKRLQRRTKTTFIFVTHDQDEAMAMSDRIAVFRSGVVEQIGTPQEIYRQPASRFVAEFVGETNILSAERSGQEIHLPELGLTRPAPAKFATCDNRFTISVRPENISLQPGAEGNLSGLVKETEFGGMTLRVLVEVPGRQTPIRAAMHGDQSGNIQVGKPVTVYVDLASAAVVGSGQ
jgi:ABC-type Fe3+/spermidine/putrescine transport system ATPase subunit